MTETMQLTTAPYNRLVPSDPPERSGGFRAFFGADYRGTALVERVERELKRKNPNMSIEVIANGRIEYPKEMEAEIQKVCELANQGEGEEAFRLLRELQKQADIKVYIDEISD